MTCSFFLFTELWETDFVAHLVKRWKPTSVRIRVTCKLSLRSVIPTHHSAVCDMAKGSPLSPAVPLGPFDHRVARASPITSSPVPVPCQSVPTKPLGRAKRRAVYFSFRPFLHEEQRPVGSNGVFKSCGIQLVFRQPSSCDGASDFVGNCDGLLSLAWIASWTQSSRFPCLSCFRKAPMRTIAPEEQQSRIGWRGGG